MLQPPNPIIKRPDPRGAALRVLVSASCLALWGGGGGSLARAEPTPPKAKSQARSCQVAYQGAQEKEKAGQLVEANQLFTSCAEIACGTAIWHECVAGSTRIRATLPSIVPVAVDEGGDPIADIEVTMDGRVITSQLTGRAIPVDPGPHDFAFSSSGAGVFASAKITVVEGERNRPLSVSRPAKTAAAPHLSSTSTTTAAK